MGKYVDFYCSDNNKELRKIVDPILANRFGWIPQKDYDDFYSIAALVVWDCEKKFNEKKVRTKKFKSFLSTCIHNKIKTRITYLNRDKRSLKDEDGNPIYDASLDISVGDDAKNTVGDIMQSDFNLENELSIHIGYDERVENLLDDLNHIQRQIVEMIMHGFTYTEIIKELGISETQYRDNMKTIKENKYTLLLIERENKKYKNMEGINMDNEYELNANDVMDLDTTDSYRTDKYPLGSLLDDFGDNLSPNYIDRTYISQREPFIWKEKQINKFYSRILNNQPIPEIVICERVVNGEKISYLIDGLQRLSYAEAFKKNLIPVKSDGAEFVNIKYKKRVEDDDGSVKLVIETFNICGKYYRDLPEFLQKRFNNFNLLVTRFFNCTPAMIDYHIRNYNNHVAMNKAQYGITNVSNLMATKIKNISKNHPFFKNNVKSTNTNRKDGSWDEVVARTIMAVNFINDWKKDVIDVFTYVNENATDSQFKRLEKNLDRLSLVVDDTVKSLFTTTNTYVWLAVYDKFSNLETEDIRFVEFMRSFKQKLCTEEIDGRCFNEIYTNRSTKDKRVVIDKINGLTDLMFEFFHINKKENLDEFDIPNEETERYIEEVKESDIIQAIKIDDNSDLVRAAMKALMFITNGVKTYSDADIQEFIFNGHYTNEDKDDVLFHLTVLNEWSLQIDNNSKILDKYNIPVLAKITQYAYAQDIEDSDSIGWFSAFADKYKDGGLPRDDMEKYKMMTESLDSYIKKKGASQCLAS